MAKRETKPKTPKTPEAAARVKIHQFGQPGANRSGNPSTAVDQREFYRWVECQATEEELKAYVLDPSKPYIRRKFVETMTRAKKSDEYFTLTNQVHGQPKQPIEMDSLPKIECKIFGDD